MASENFENFNERLSQWVANQGFWFQVRFSMASGGSKGVVMVHLVRFATRLLLLAAVVGIGVGVYLFKLPNTAGFMDKLEAAIGAGLGAKEAKMSGFKRVQGFLQIAKVAGEGTSKTFFSTFEARSIKCQMGILNSLPGEWNIGVLSISDLDIHLNAGADDAESAKGISESLFREFGDLKFETVDVKSATVGWGFSERTRGIIDGSHLKIQRVPEGWRINVSGGLFSQNWLKRLEIVELVALCTPDGIQFEKAEFKKGNGQLRMDGLQLTAGERPEVKGVVEMTQVPIEDLIPVPVKDRVDGIISGNFRVFGSTNTKEGLGFEGKIVVDEKNPLKLRDRIVLLQALTEFAVFSSFKTVEFKDGSLKIKTQGGGMELTEVNLRAPQVKADAPEIQGDSGRREVNSRAPQVMDGDLMTLTGQMQVRFPTPEEAAAVVERNRAIDGGTGLGMQRDPIDALRAGDDPEFNLRRAASAAQRARERAEGGGRDEQGPSLFDRIGQGFEARRKAEQLVELQARTLIYEGAFQITLLADTFETMPALRELFPVDPQTGRIPMDVPVNGELGTITYDQTEDLYQRARPNSN
jgi:hypothetical protein